MYMIFMYRILETYTGMYAKRYRTYMYILYMFVTIFKAISNVFFFLTLPTFSLSMKKSINYHSSDSCCSIFLAIFLFHFVFPPFYFFFFPLFYFSVLLIDGFHRSYEKGGGSNFQPIPVFSII